METLYINFAIFLVFNFALEDFWSFAQGSAQDFYLMCGIPGERVNDKNCYFCLVSSRRLLGIVQQTGSCPDRQRLGQLLLDTAAAALGQLLATSWQLLLQLLDVERQQKITCFCIKSMWTFQRHDINVVTLDCCQITCHQILSANLLKTSDLWLASKRNWNPKPRKEGLWILFQKHFSFLVLKPIYCYEMFNSPTFNYSLQM